PFVAQALALETAEQQPSILKNGWVKSAPDGHRGNVGDVLPVFVHNKQLQCRCGIALRRRETITVAGEGDLSTRDWARPEIQDSVPQAVVLLGRVDRIGFKPIARPSVRRELLEGESLDLACLEVNTVNVTSLDREIVPLSVQLVRLEVWKFGIVAPLGIE